MAASYARTITLDIPYDEAVPRVKEAFKAQGFGTLTETDVRATLAEKLGTEIEPYVILGACNLEVSGTAGLEAVAEDAGRRIDLALEALQTG